MKGPSSVSTFGRPNKTASKMSEFGLFDILIDDSVGREHCLSGSVSPATSSSSSSSSDSSSSAVDFVSETRDLALGSNPDLLTASLAESGLLLEDNHQVGRKQSRAEITKVSDSKSVFDPCYLDRYLSELLSLV